jgi:VIT1/CCC1 family predicted Fe2+/Mn2+ transporter
MSADGQTPSSAEVRAATAGRGPSLEPHTANAAGRLNWLRTGVLGANDGIVSVAGIVVGVAGATSARGPIFTAGLAGLVAGAVSMALGEYVSVSSQRDSQDTLLAQEKRELAESPELELAELAAIYQDKGLSEATAGAVAAELTAHDVSAVLVTLGIAGAISARIGGSGTRRAVLRVVIGGAVGLAFTYGVGNLFGTAIG